MQQDAGSGGRLVEVLGTPSLAIDLNVGQSMEHALRSAILAVRLGDALGLDETELTDCYYLALLRHVGCTAEARTAAAVFQDEITARTWFAPVVNGRRSEMFAAILLNMGNDKGPLDRARRLVAPYMRPRSVACRYMHGPAETHACRRSRLRGRAAPGRAVGVRAGCSGRPHAGT